MRWIGLQGVRMQTRRPSADAEQGPGRFLISMSDVAGYSRLLSGEQRDQQERLTNVQRIAARNAGLQPQRSNALIQPSGDGELVRWPADTDEIRLVSDYPRELHAELVRVNRTLIPESWMRLRVALTSGLSEIGKNGIVGDAPVRAARLVNARQAREALELDPQHLLVLVLDDVLYREVVQQGHRGLREEDFVHIVVREKEFEGDAWLTVPGADPRKLAGLAGRRRTGPRPNAKPKLAEADGRDDHTRGTRLRSPGGLVAIVVAVIGAAGAVTAATIPAIFSDPATPTASATTPGPGPITSSADVPSPTTQLPTHVPVTQSGPLFAEWTDNHLGTKVFADPEGDAVAANQLIPFDTEVQVKCWADNKSEMGSINAFYLVETNPWANRYAPANTFANGDPIGQPGSTAIDPAVPHC